MAANAELGIETDTPQRQAPKLDEVYVPLWVSFDRLSQGRQPGFNGPTPLVVSEILLYHATLEPWPYVEDFLDIMQALDRDAVAAINKRISEASKKNR